MAGQLNAITGATGLLGSHIAQRLTDLDQQVRALVRPTSDTALLEQLGVELIRGDLSDPQAVDRLIAGADVAYHCAAKTGNWGSWSEHVAGTVQTTRQVVRACQRHPGLRRLLHVSSIAVYGHPRPKGDKLDERAPLGQRPWLWDYYMRAKIAAEQEARSLDHRVTIVRPTWMFGHRDAANIPALVRAVRHGGAWLIGNGDNLLNMVHAGDVAEAAIRAATATLAEGQAYNVCTDGQLTQRELVETVCQAVGAPPVRRQIPYRLVHVYALLSEIMGRVWRSKRPPWITRHGMAVFVRPPCYSYDKARADLAWKPGDVRQQLAVTLEWLRETETPMVRDR